VLAVIATSWPDRISPYRCTGWDCMPASVIRGGLGPPSTCWPTAEPNSRFPKFPGKWILASQRPWGGRCAKILLGWSASQRFLPESAALTPPAPPPPAQGRPDPRFRNPGVWTFLNQLGANFWVGFTAGFTTRLSSTVGRIYCWIYYTIVIDTMLTVGTRACGSDYPLLFRPCFDGTNPCFALVFWGYKVVLGSQRTSRLTDEATDN